MVGELIVDVCLNGERRSQGRPPPTINHQLPTVDQLWLIVLEQGHFRVDSGSRILANNNYQPQWQRGSDTINNQLTIQSTNMRPFQIIFNPISAAELAKM